MTDKDYQIATKLVRGGQHRSENRETSEALYMTSGFVYDTAEQAAAAFRDEIDTFVYSRYGNPTVKMFEQRLALLEGAEACRATGTGMAGRYLVPWHASLKAVTGLWLAARFLEPAMQF